MNLLSGKKRIIATVGAIIIAAVSVIAVFPSASVQAASYNKEYARAVASAVRNCYSTENLFLDELTVEGYKKDDGIYNFMRKKNVVVYLPNYSGGINAGANYSISCGDLMNILISDSGGYPNDGNSDAIAKFYTNTLGYKNDGTRCVYWTYTGVLDGQYTTDQVCAKVDDSGKITSNVSVVASTGNLSYIGFSKCSGSKLCITTGSGAHTVDTTHRYSYGSGDSWNSMVSSIEGVLANDFSTVRKLSLTQQTLASGHTITQPYVIDRTKTISGSFGTAIKALLDTSTYTMGSPTIFALYQNYLVDYYDADITCGADNNQEDDSAEKSPEEDGYYAIKYYDGSEVKNCYAKPGANKKKKVYGVSSNVFDATGNTKLGFSDIAEWLNNSKVTAEQLASLNLYTNSSVASDGDPCMDHAESLGWILCPVLSGVSKVTDWLYDAVIEDFLVIDTDLFTEGNGAIYATWQTFQTFANVVFVIMLLVVIISQLTGVGIDNYGIKKILPRLIVSALLINFSYIICQLAVDASNIAGISLNNLFNSLAGNINLSVTADGASAVGNIASILTIAIGTATAAIATLALGPGLIITLLLSVITAFISILFVFILLGIRQAVVVVLTAVSPIVFVLYMLPNTKQYFDKVVKIFGQMLLLFPICGLLIGGGNFVSRLLLSTNSDSFLFSLAAMLIAVVPFFFIPTILKSSFSALGNIGTTVANMTKRAGQAVNKGTKNSRTYQTMMARSAAGRNMFTGRANNGIRRRIAQSDTALGRYARRHMSAGEGVLTKFAGEDVESKNLINPTYAENLRAVSGAAANARLARVTDPNYVKNRTAGEINKMQDEQIKDRQSVLVNQFGSDFGQFGGEFERALKAYNANPDDANAQVDLRAVMNELSKTDKGRDQIRGVTRQMAAESADANGDSGNEAGLTFAANHLLNQFGDVYKSKDRGFNNWITAAAGGTIGRVESHYGDGTDKYTAESLANADEQAIKNMVTSFNARNADGSYAMSSENRNDIARTAYEAINNPNIQLKPEVRKDIEQMASNHTPSLTPEQTHLKNLQNSIDQLNQTVASINPAANNSARTPNPNPNPSIPRNFEQSPNSPLIVPRDENNP